MGRSGREEKMSRNDSNNEEGAMLGLKKGPWTPEEDQKLSSYVQQYGEGNWRSLSSKAGLKRCGKSCRLRWNNYLRPDIKTGNFSLEEERTIIQLHALLGNRWSAIATHLPKRTDSKIKNHWNSHIKKRLAKMGIDPVTHKPNVDKLSHMTQWEAARLEAEARLVKQPKQYPHYLISPSSSSTHEIHKGPPTSIPYLRCLDVLKVWQGTLTSKEVINGGLIQTLDSPSTFFKEVPPIVPTTHAESKCSLNQGVNTRPHDETESLKQRFDDELIYTHDADFSTGDPLISPPSFCQGFLDLPISEAADDHEAIHDEDEWTGLASNLVLNTWPPVFSQIV